MVPQMPEEFLDVAATVAEVPLGAASRGAAPSQSTPAANSNKIKAPLSALSPDIVPIKPNFPAYAFTETHGPPLRNGRNQVMCLNFHVKADCWKSCCRKADHKKHSEADSKKLAKYLASKAAWSCPHPGLEGQDVGVLTSVAPLEKRQKISMANDINLPLQPELSTLVTTNHNPYHPPGVPESGRSTRPFPSQQ
jgi:hypothetical protein